MKATCTQCGEHRRIVLHYAIGGATFVVNGHRRTLPSKTVALCAACFIKKDNLK